MRALIVENGRDRSMLVAARALHADGWQVTSTSWGESLVALSRSVAAHRPSLHTDQGPRPFAESIASVVQDGGHEVVLVSWEAALHALSAHRDLLGGAALVAGDADAVRDVLDKRTVFEAARRAGLDVPPTLDASGDGDVLDGWDGPLVVKPALQQPTNYAAVRFSGPDAAARARIAEVHAGGGAPLVQPQLTGQLCAFTCSCRPDGELLTVAQQVAEQQWPRPVGITARGLTVPPDPGLHQLVSDLARELRWQGLLQCQFLVGEDGRAWLLDVNPRPYGSLALAVRAGADHVSAAARIVTGRPVVPAWARPGVRFQWTSRDLRASVHAERRAAELVRFARALPSAHSVWSSSDPLVAPRFALRQLRRWRISRGEAA